MWYVNTHLPHHGFWSPVSSLISGLVSGPQSQVSRSWLGFLVLLVLDLWFPVPGPWFPSPRSLVSGSLVPGFPVPSPWFPGPQSLVSSFRPWFPGLWFLGPQSLVSSPLVSGPPVTGADPGGGGVQGVCPPPLFFGQDFVYLQYKLLPNKWLDPPPPFLKKILPPPLPPPPPPPPPLLNSWICPWSMVSSLWSRISCTSLLKRGASLTPQSSFI